MITRQQALHGRVSGLVQGVCFRAETRDMARRLGLTGWVRNTPDGDVELLIAGPVQAIEDMQRWLQKGPDMARVSEVNLQRCPDPGVSDFEIRY